MILTRVPPATGALALAAGAYVGIVLAAAFRGELAAPDPA